MTVRGVTMGRLRQDWIWFIVLIVGSMAGNQARLTDYVCRLLVSYIVTLGPVSVSRISIARATGG